MAARRPAHTISVSPRPLFPARSALVISFSCMIGVVAAPTALEVYPVHLFPCRFCRSALSQKLLGALRNSRFESVSTAHRVFWLSIPQNCIGERGRSNLHMILHNDGPSSDFAERKSG